MKTFAGFSLGAAFGAAIFLGATAPAQVLKNHDSNAPVNFSADRIEVQDRSDRVVVSGNVHVTQAGLTLDAARMTVAYNNGGGGNGIELERIDESGNVVVRKGNETARGSVAIYDLNLSTITTIGHVKLTQDTNLLTGAWLLKDQKSDV